MSAFVGGGDNPAFTLTNDGFWPNIDGDDLRAAQRIGADVSNMRLETAAVAAIISINRELRPLKMRHLAAGHDILQAVPADQVNGTSELVHTYLRAIYCTTSAEVAERYRNYDTTNSGTAKAEEENTSADDYRRDARFAIRDLLGISRNTVELL
ncbi:head completion/stabilization protein [Ectopseudomonas khazarica]|uniref:head completion/stabilization protein n=1 Tax=Ectopseudomonas khazarica TaxID=2502979 RepID=UPI001AEF91AF|nr:head completion/stabilization protein [Pseudomonas khazarica]QTS88885.1 head completion/stabilization protein [Pseudomonas khazarica]